MTTRRQRSIAVAALILAALPAAAQTIVFPQAFLEPLESLPSAMVAADLNRDGHVDLVVTHFVEQTATVLLGTGASSFVKVGEFSSGGPAIRILSADVDRDDIPDVMVSEEESDNVWFLRGIGDGSLAAPQKIVAGHDPVGLALGDLDGDHLLDLLVGLSDEAGPKLGILRGSGDGQFAPLQTLTLSGDVDAVVLADFDNDDRLDGAFSDPQRDAVRLLRGVGGGQLALGEEISVGGGAGPLAVADVDENGQPDILVANTADNSVTVLRSRGDGSFEPPLAFATGGRGLNGITTADVNGDDHIDIIGSHVRSQGVDILLGRGDGSFGAPRGFITDSDPIAVATLDFDGDGLLDVVTANEGAGDALPSLAVIRGDGEGHFAALQQLPAARNSVGVAVADFNEDALVDAVAGAPDDRAVALYLGSDLPDVPPVPQLFEIDGAPLSLLAGDFDGDDHADIITLASRQIAILYGDGQGQFAGVVKTALSGNSNAFALIDFDRDGDLDLMVARSAAPLALVPLRNDPGRVLTTLSDLPVNGQLSSLRSADVTGDGITDLVSSELNNARLGLFVGRAEGGLEPFSLLTIPSITASLAAADVDANGTTDLALSLPLTHMATTVLSDGSGALTPGRQVQIEGFPNALALRDLDDDGLPELIVNDQLANSTTILTNRGAALFRFDSTLITSVRAGAIATADFDADGRYDVMTIGSTIVRLPNLSPTTTVRGDGNVDGEVSAADFVALVRELGDGDGHNPDDVRRGSFVGGAGADCDGDTEVNAADLRALPRKLWHNR